MADRICTRYVVHSAIGCGEGPVEFCGVYSDDGLLFLAALSSDSYLVKRIHDKCQVLAVTIYVVGS